jgi:hypothetical protein
MEIEQEWGMSIYLIVMRGTDENDGSIVRNVKSASGSYLSEKYLGDDTPEQQSGFICDCWRHYGNQ